MSREATSEQSSVREGAGYDKVFQWKVMMKRKVRKKREKRVWMRVDEGGEDEEYKGEDDGNEGEVDGSASEGGSLGSPGDGHTRQFILPKMWTVNDFKQKMTVNIFKNLWDRYQIPDHIPIRLPRKFEKCYSGKIVEVAMYDAMFAAGLRLPLTALHRKLANFLRLSINQVTPNA